MKFEEYQEKLNQLQKLVNLSNAGSPKNLARILNVSERTTRRMVEKLKQQKIPIKFCRKINSCMIKN